MTYADRQILWQLKASRHQLTKQQFKTLRGQLRAGNGEDALKGLRTILKRQRGGGANG